MLWLHCAHGRLPHGSSVALCMGGLREKVKVRSPTVTYADIRVLKASSSSPSHSWACCTTAAAASTAETRTKPMSV